MNKLKIWNEKSSWDDSEAAWEKGAKEASQEKALKGLKNLPEMIGIVPETAKHLKWKSLKWMFLEDHKGEIRRGFFRNPFKYAGRYLLSIFKKKSYKRENDLFFYGLDSLKQFEKLLADPNNLLVLGFSYCHKPFECPSGRFTAECLHDPENLVCRQCFIGKAVNALPANNAIALFIPTVHYIGGKILEIVHQNPHKRIIFIITACEMTLEMFGDWGNMVGIKGIGVRLSGRICNTMKAFELSEQGIKPGLTVVLDETQRKILDLIRYRRESSL